MIQVITPYSLEKNIGKAYNEAMSIIPEDSWACLIDHDVMFLTPDAIFHMHEYVRQNPNTGIFTCFTNRLHKLAKQQLRLGYVSHNYDIKAHLEEAENMKAGLYEATQLNKHISGFLMLISKKTWNEIKFDETGKCLGVDNKFSDAILQSGRKILRMDGIYVWHSYRLLGGVDNKTHLK